MTNGLTEMLRYNQWANATLFEACRGVSEAAMNSKSAGTSGSTRELLTHIVGAQQTFVLRTLGRQHEGEFDRNSPWPGVATLVELVSETSAQLIAVAERLDPDSHVDLPYEGALYRYPVRFFLVHAVAHGTEHRTEIKVNLGHVGIETPDLDGWSYGDAAGYGRDVTPGSN